MTSMAFTRKHAVLGALALSAAIALPMLSPAEAAPPSYDGLWSVVITTQQGICEPTYRAPIRINKGQMVNAGGGQFQINGRVGKNGAVVVQVTQGANSASGSGHLNATRGGGSWSRRPVRGHLARREAGLIEFSDRDRLATDLSDARASARASFFRATGAPRQASAYRFLSVSCRTQAMSFPAS